MTFLSLPSPLRNLLGGSALEAPTLEIVDAVGKILDANELQFFPAYTDHGTHHVNRVLEAIVRLAPVEAMEEGLLSDADATILICAALFHDLALHMRDQGFVQLVSGETDHKPIPWFDDDQVGRPADLPWPTLWSSFQAEAQHFGTSQLELMLGSAGDRVPRVAYEERLQPATWTQSDRLLIGEFLRRHHGRLSHEVAMYGFPGASPESFPIVGKTMPQLANAIGLVARSHQEPLRTMLEYLAYWEPGSKRPAGAFVLYDMALLRIADYFQIDADRAPPLLLRLKAPMSPRSIEQWEQHRAISAISFKHDDPLAIYIAVSPQHGLRTHLALTTLFDDMQRELDTATAVLSEQYATNDLSQLRLTKQRVRSNLDAPSMHAQLPYVPRRAALQSDTDLFRLVINDLYGNRPAVAGRELIQNAVDAVRARRTFEAHSSHQLLPSELRELEADVVVTLEKGQEGKLILRIADRGIGMTAETVIDSYLQAGASFRPTASEKAKEGPLGVEQLRAGRFGIGAFAGFLLGPEIRVTTRHGEAERGLSFVARIDEDLVRIDWVDAQIGTEIEIPFDAEAILAHTRHGTHTAAHFLEEIATFYRLKDPEVIFIDRSDDIASSISSPADRPGPGEELPRLWRRVECEGFDDVTWYPQTGDGGRLSHNGIVIKDPAFAVVPVYRWSDPKLQTILNRPPLSIFDSRHAIGINLQRYGLTDDRLPFERRLLESIGTDFVAHALSLGTTRYPLQGRSGDSPIYSETGWMPPWPPLLQRYQRGPILVLWLFPFFLPDTDASAVLTMGPSSWKVFPHRTRVMLDPTISPAVTTLEKALTAIGRNAERWGELFGARELASIMASGNSASEFHELLRDENFDSVAHDWRTIDTGREKSDPFTYIRRTEAADSSLEQALIAVSNDFLSNGRWPVAALSAFDCLFTDAGPLQHLAAPWIQILEGDLSRDRSLARETREVALTYHADLQPLVKTWDMTAAGKMP